MADIYVTSPIPPYPTAVGATASAFTARQDVSPLPLPVVLPYQLRLGTKIRLEAAGEFSTTGTPTLVLGFYIGTSAAAITTPIAESSAITTASGAAAFPWFLEWTGTVVGLGTTGSVVGQGNINFGTSLIAYTATPIPITQALRTFTWDTTIARAIGICATYSANSASNTVKTNHFAAYLIN